MKGYSTTPSGAPTEIVLGLEGKEAPEMALSELNRRREQPGFVEWLADETGRSAKAIEKALEQITVDDPLRWPEWDQVATYAGLVRRDDNGDPCIIPAGSLYVTAGTARRQTGTQYTPRTLTESVVEHALAPLVYVGTCRRLAARRLAAQTRRTDPRISRSAISPVAPRRSSSALPVISPRVWWRHGKRPNGSTARMFRSPRMATRRVACPTKS